MGIFGPSKNASNWRQNGKMVSYHILTSNRVGLLILLSIAQITTDLRTFPDYWEGIINNFEKLFKNIWKPS